MRTGPPGEQHGPTEGRRSGVPASGVFAASPMCTCGLLEVILLGAGDASLSAEGTELQLSPAEAMAM